MLVHPKEQLRNGFVTLNYCPPTLLAEVALLIQPEIAYHNNRRRISNPVLRDPPIFLGEEVRTVLLTEARITGLLVDEVTPIRK